jgi:hypothetical protein
MADSSSGILTRTCSVIVMSFAAALAACGERRVRDCPPPTATVTRNDLPALVIATPADTPAARRAIVAAQDHRGPVLLVRVGLPPVAPEVLVVADQAGAGPNSKYVEASAAGASRCFQVRATEALSRIGPEARGDELGQIPTLVGLGADAGNGDVTLVEVGLARHTGSGVDFTTADLSTPELRQRLVADHLNAGVLTRLVPGTTVVLLAAGEGAPNSVEAGFLKATAQLVCAVLTADATGASCVAAEEVPR